VETLALIELLDRDAQVRHTVRVTAWPVRIGRAIDCNVVLDDPHVAPHHADLVVREDGVHVVPAPSVNGVRLGRARIAEGSSARVGGPGLLGLGTTTLRVRLAGEALAPEQRLVDVQTGGRQRAVALVALVVLAAAWAVFNQWLSSAPGESSTELTRLYLAAPVVLGIWCGLWAMASKLFQRQFAFWPHLEAALFWPLLAMLVGALSAQLAFALSLPVLAKAGSLVGVGAIAMLLWTHLRIVLPQRRREFAWVVASMVVVGGGLDLAERVHRQQPLVGGLYLGTLSLPGVRVAKPVSAEAFVESAQPLEKTLARWSKSAADDVEAPTADDED
jgi:pSer/pThr/pTyr-binding forkhead associated (FHA) protein